MKFSPLPQGFHLGHCLDAYRYLGAHPATADGVSGFTFRTWAPAALSVEVIGEWNSWRGEPMMRHGSGVWSGFCPRAKQGQMYKYRIVGADGYPRDKADPYAFRSELRPGTASILWDLSKLPFSDGPWCASRSNRYNEPMNIYELHAGSWRRNPDGSWLTYAQLADQLIPYLKELSFNFVELLPLSEYPFDGSWGYQVSGYFSLTSRYGTPEDFAYFVNSCHQNGIGVIMDFVPVHFAMDAFSLTEYDGTALYEYDSDVGQSEWGSANFNLYRSEVRSFLSSAAAFWLEKYHCDGIRMDAVSNAIYWQGDEERGVNEGGLDFMRKMNQGLHKKFPTAILIAEDSSHYPHVTGPAALGGLGFDYKWDMGWMHDTLDYFSLPFQQRPQKTRLLTFSMDYFYNEKYIPALSHDENVHGKKTVIDKLYGTYEEKFAQARLLYLYMFTHPGKKLNFMGSELAHWREWDEAKSLDENLLDYPLHAGFQRYFGALGRLYTLEPTLHRDEYLRSSFAWVCDGENKDGIFAYLRRSKDCDLLVVLNTLNHPRTACSLKLPYPCTALPLLASDQPQWGGDHPLTAPRPTLDTTLTMSMPPLSGIVLKLVKKRQ